MFDLLGVVVEALDSENVVHMVAGSVASARHGEARATQDIDIVIDPSPDQMDRLLHRLRSGNLYVGDGHAALAHRSAFNVIDTRSGWKVDLIVMRDREFSRVELGRRQPATFGPVETHVASPEDCVLSKLEWASGSGSERQLRDVRSLLAIQGPSMDTAYLERWAAVLGVSDLLAEVRPQPGT